MKIMAVICEYNPFHNGHAYQLNEQKMALSCDGVICLMSGSFVQRGEPAICDKWARAEMALACGCDLVLELPVIYSLQSAEGFARGAVTLLKELGAEGYLAFGSECGDVKLLQDVAAYSETESYQNSLKNALLSGLSYPAACSLAFASNPELSANLAEQPNDILGIEYIRAINKANAPLTPLAIRRIGDYNSREPVDNFLSATGIRQKISAGEDIRPYMPPKAHAILQQEIKEGRAPVTPDGLTKLLQYALLRADKSDLCDICGISEGLENRIVDAAAKLHDFYEVAQAAKTKRYPQTRLQRAMINILLGITKGDAALSPAYARVLGMNENSGAILKQLREKSAIPIITKTADASLKDENAKRMFALDCTATDLYSLLYPEKNKGKNGMDFYRSPMVIQSQPE